MYETGTEEGVEPFTLMLRTGHWYTARYAFAVLPWSAVKETSTLLSVSRRATRRWMFTVPFLHQVGLVVVGPERGWSPIASTATTDRTSLRSVIVQGIHFLDLETGASVVNRSQWGSIRFGHTTGVSKVVEEVLA
jgi:hypothetical protein